jgi:hypothetical protein
MRVPLLLLAIALLCRSEDLALTHVTVIDTRSGGAQPDQTVVIKGDRIARVGPASRIKPAGDIRVIDGRGKFLIPGLWDMHVHLGPLDHSVATAWSLPLLVANGITGVRSMFDDLALIRKLRTGIANGTIAGPRIVASGPILDGPKPIWPGSVAVSNADQGRAAVHDLKAMGVDFIKVYDLLPRDGYFAIAAEARRERMVFAGHVPVSLTAADASDAGQKSIEHVALLLYSTSLRERELRQASVRIDILAAAADSFDEAKASALFRKFASNGMWVTPTLVYGSHFTQEKQEEYRGDPRFSSLPPDLKPFWEQGWTAARTFADSAARGRVTERSLQLVREMRANGVKLLAGSDMLNPFVYPGSSLQEELELLVKSGLSPTEALQAATLRPAEYLGMTDRFGIIETGKLADLVLLDANPLENITNTRRITAVVLNGRLHLSGRRE